MKIMKKIIYCIGAAAMLLAVSCAKEQAPVTEPADNLVKMTFTATTDMATKTSLHTDGKSVNWSDRDKISVFAINEGAVASHTAFAAENINGTTADFTGATDADATDFVALYPYNSAASVTVAEGVTTVKTTIPYTQKAVKGGFDPALNLMLATTTKDANHFSFKNLCSLIKVTIPENLTDITAISFRTRLAMTGTFTYNVTEGTVSKSNDNYGKSLTLASEDGSALEPGTYYIVAGPNPSTDATQQIQSLSVTLSDGTVKTIIAQKSFTLKSNTIYNLGTVSLDNAKDFTVTNAPQGDFPMGVKSYQLTCAGATEGSTITYTSRSGKVATVDANGLVTFTGDPGNEFIHVKADGVEAVVTFNVVKGYYKEVYNQESLTDNQWYAKSAWANSSHQAKAPEVTESSLKIYPLLTVKDNYNTYRCDMKKSGKSYLNIEYPIVCFHLEDVKDVYGVNRNITFDVVEKDGGIGGPVQANNNDGKYKYTVDGKKILIYDLTQQTIGGKYLADYGIIEFNKTFQLKYADINTATKKTDLTAELSLDFYGFHTFRTLEDAKAYFGITE